MKKTVVALLAVTLTLSLLPACGSKEAAEVQTTPAEETEVTAEAAETPAPDTTPEQSNDTENLAPDITNSEWGPYIIEQNPTMEITLQLQSKGNSPEEIFLIYTTFEGIKSGQEDNADLDSELSDVKVFFEQDYSAEYLAWRRQFWDDPVQKNTQTATRSQDTRSASSSQKDSGSSDTSQSNKSSQNTTGSGYQGSDYYDTESYGNATPIDPTAPTGDLSGYEILGPSNEDLANVDYNIR